MKRLACLLVVSLLAESAARAEEWPRFRGPDGRGVGDSAVPLEWSGSHNLLWKTPLPGPGSSSPVVHGDDVFVTCYSGYGTGGERGGERAKLVRHLLCIDRATGKEKWRRDVPAELPEDAFEGYLTEHGYASSTPVVDDDAVYASPVLSGGSILVATRWNGTLVLPAKPVFEVLACNRFAADESDTSGTPAIADGRLYLRSARFLYAIGRPTGAGP